MASLPLVERQFTLSMAEHLAHPGRGTNHSIMFSSSPLEASSERQTASFTIDSILEQPCSSSELHEVVKVLHVPSCALSRPPLSSKGSQVDTNAYSTIYPGLGYSDPKDSIPLQISLNSGTVIFHHLI
ncbi:hypothetical protein ECG_02528 [Echinococcus granulosus]|nr:hypothetical protein ECG_02528 [Echinococcus granulosus]